MAIDEWGREALADPALRPVAPELLHVTLAFLGYLPEREIEPLAEIVRGAAGAAPSIELGEPVSRPERGRPHLFALPVESPGTVMLQAGLEEKLVAARLYRAEKRPFWPHVTLARVRREKRGLRRPALVSRPPAGLPKGLLQPFDAVRIVLYLSQIQPQGAQYTPLAQVELPGGGRLCG
jgi:2'-5' RNA ligase